MPSPATPALALRGPRPGTATTVAAVVLAGILAACSGAATPSDDTPDETATATDTVISIDGLDEATTFNAATLAEATITITADAPAATVVVLVDGAPLPGDQSTAPGDGATPSATTSGAPSAPATATSPAPTGDQDGPTVVTIDAAVLAALGDGDHLLEVTAGRDTMFRNPSSTQASFTIDTTPPTLTLPDTVEASDLTGPLEVAFTVQDGVEVTSATGTVALDADQGTVSFEQPPTEVALVALDAAGNTAEATVPVIVAHPGMRAVHTTPYAWDYEPKRTAILDLIEADLIDTVQLDVKDEAGAIGFDSQVELADLSGADEAHRNFDAMGALETLHDLDIRVVGRVVVYKDPILAQWAWENGRRDYVTQTPDGQPFTGSYGEFAFTNPANEDVQQYNEDIALEAADMGFDEILYDYIRRPDGDIDSMVFPGLGDRTPEEAVVEVMADVYPQLRERGVWVGASVFGIAVDRPLEIAQDIPAMAPHVDYIAPMVYPDHWGPGEYDVADPVAAPYDIVNLSLAEFQSVLEPTGTEVIPWLASFRLSGDTTAGYIRDQIDATTDATGEEWFLLWNPGANYMAESLEPIGSEGP